MAQYVEPVYTPLIKVKGFDPSPLASGIPDFANGEKNEKVIGTSLYNEFWDEQVDRCINGYTTGGVFLPGTYYFFLNAQKLKGLLGSMYPMYVDMDLEIFKSIHEIKKSHKAGTTIIKARRKGISEISQTHLNHGVRFIEGYRGAVIAGKETYVTGLRNKFLYAHNNFVNEFKIGTLQDNEKRFRAGFNIRDDIGGWQEEGFHGQIDFETVFDDPAKLEGEYYNDVICEESGQNKRLGATVDSIKPALEFGAIMMGMFWIYGTGGNILTGSKDFKDYFDNHGIYDLDRMFISGKRKYFPFYGNKFTDYFIDKDTGEKIDSIPNLRHLTESQRLGVEDVKAAEDYIRKKTDEYSRLPNKVKLIKWKQSYPLSVEDAFTSSGNNNFNSGLIHTQIFYIDDNPHLVKAYVLNYVMENTGSGTPIAKYPLEVVARPANDKDKDWEKVWIYQMPEPDYANLDIGGVDGYNQDQTQTGNSLGAHVVLRNGKSISNHKYIHNAIYPVCLYYDRPPRKELFFEISQKIAVFYGCKNNTMCNAEQEFVIDYYTKNGGRMYLAKRPKSFDSPNSKIRDVFGAKMTMHSKPLMLGIVQSLIESYVEHFYFRKILIDGLAYDEQNIGTDWDSIDATGLAAMRIWDMKSIPREIDHGVETDYIEWVLDKDGNPIPTSNMEDKSYYGVKLGEYEGGWSGNNLSDNEMSKNRVQFANDYLDLIDDEKFR